MYTNRVLWMLLLSACISLGVYASREFRGAGSGLASPRSLECLAAGSGVAVRSGYGASSDAEALEELGSPLGLEREEDRRVLARLRPFEILIAGIKVVGDGPVRPLVAQEVVQHLEKADVICIGGLHTKSVGVAQALRLARLLACEAAVPSESIAAFFEAVPEGRAKDLTALIRTSAPGERQRATIDFMQEQWPWPALQYAETIPALEMGGVSLFGFGQAEPRAMPPVGTPDAMRKPVGWLPVHEWEARFRASNERAVRAVSAWTRQATGQQRRAIVVVGLEHLLGPPDNIVPALRMLGLHVVTVLPFVPEIERALLSAGVPSEGWVSLARDVYRPTPPSRTDVRAMVAASRRRAEFWGSRGSGDRPVLDDR